MVETSDFTTIVDHIRTQISLGGIRVIGVEGFPTAGKSTLVRKLAAEIRCACVHTDDFLQPGCREPAYIRCLDLKRLGARVDQEPEPVLIEGIGLLDSLDAIGRGRDLGVYVKRMTQAGLWADDLANYSVDGQPLEGISQVDYWAVEYHLRRHPHVDPDVMFAYNGDEYEEDGAT
jgi:hypothetical protein